MMARASFEQSLAHCLRELTRTGDVGASLRCYPQYADRLRPLLEMAQVTRRYYDAVPQAPGGLAAGRERLLAVAAQQRARGVSTTSTSRTTIARGKGRNMKLVLAARLIAVLLAAVVVTAALAGGAIWAAEDSLPGDVLYPIKLAVEDVRLAFASAPADQVDLALQFAEERANDVRALVATGRQVPDETIARMEQHIEHALTQAAWASDEEIANLLMRIAKRLRVQERILEEVRATAPQPALAGLERAVTVYRWGAEAAEDGLRDPGAFRWRYRHRRGIPEPTHEPERVTDTPGSDQGQNRESDPQQGQERYQQRDQECECTPVGTPHMTPHGPRATPVPQATPPRLQRTPVPPTATPQPQQPGDRQGGDGRDGGDHGEGGQDDSDHGGGGQDGDEHCGGGRCDGGQGGGGK
jgi:hypothetical protein